ncbi:glutamate--cysteine ligase [Oecophyllibacter saccharovorans]|uniref:glutamate--cysteine ligase n=1 Tax=Oecophyllibacter saccharovorans TaxID=2558360 RepID=UPI00116DAA00|nr:glutamate--cysteine ligase [Oecophyllibacter saccharovorans]TPW34768.1 glutamate--cysteine ligase [Oecophyllibacter saccharovorans]
MSNPGESNSTPIRNKGQLVEVLARGSKPRQDWKIGTEHEKFGFTLPGAAKSEERAPYAPPPYAPRGIQNLLQSFEGKDFSPLYDGPNVIGLKGQAGEKDASISLEPAGQFELSGAPVSDLHQTRAEMARHFEALKAPAARLGLGFAPLGFQPLWPREDMPWMPKSRYAIMRRYMPKVGTGGLDMMTRSCTVQVNLDFSDEADMVRKMQVSLALQPLASALFANSPFEEGKPSGWLSTRMRSWLNTDPARSGQPAEFFAPDFGFEKYVDWALDVPMYFVMRDGKYHDVAGASFRRWLEGNGEGILADLTPTVGDFEDHLTTLFPDVRLKQFLEMRGADAGSPEMMLAQSALWVGLLYDESVLAEVEALVREHSWETWRALRPEVARKAMEAPFPGGLRPLAQRVLQLADKGLKARGLGEEVYLAPLHEIAAGGPTQAEKWLEKYHTVWKGDVRPIFQEAAV